MEPKPEPQLQANWNLALRQSHLLPQAQAGPPRRNVLGLRGSPPATYLCFREENIYKIDFISFKI